MWKEFWRGIRSIFDIGGAWYDPPEPPAPDPRTDAEKIRDDWQKILPPDKRKGP